MTKAEQRALEKYPRRKDGQTRGYVCDDNDVRRIYSQGYRKAEEDQRMLERVINSQKHVIPVPGKKGLEDMTTREEEDTEAIKWLRELTSRIRPVQEWSEEDARNIDGVVELIRDYALETGQIDEESGEPKDPYASYIRFVRSRRPQPHWKPSDAQMQALEFVLEYHVFASPQNKEHINSLHNDLQKLL